MNSKELKGERKIKKNKTNLKNGGQQIYVLPPNLLEKLGINLGNMGSTPISSDLDGKISNKSHIPVNKHGQSSTNTPHHELKGNYNNETSILKTASLMKESVFLSPTFNNIVVNKVPDSQVEEYMVVSNPHTSKKCEELENKEFNPPDTAENSYISNTELSKKHNDTVIDTDMDLSMENNNLPVPIINIEKPLLQGDAKKKINIISKETITPIKLNELKSSQITKTNVMIPASLNTLIVKHIALNTVTKSHITTTFAKDTDMPSNGLDNNLVDSKIKISIDSDTKIEEKTEAKMCDPAANKIEISKDPDTKVYDKIEVKICEPVVNTCNADNNIKNALKLDFQKCDEKKDLIKQDIQKIEYKQIQLDKSSENNNSQVLLYNKICNKSPDDSTDESVSVYGPNPNIGSNDAVTELLSTCQDFTADTTICNSLNNYHSKQLLCNSNNNPLLDDYINNENIDENTEIVKLDDVTQQMECHSFDININNNNCEHNTSDFGQNEVLVKNTINVDEDKKLESDINNEICDKTQGGGFKSGYFDASKEQDNSIIISEEYARDIYKTREVKSFINQGIEHENVSFSPKEMNPTTNYSYSNSEDCGNQLSLPVNPTRNHLMSKLCIQGVEKPGGINLEGIQNTLSLKTYSNIKRNMISSQEKTAQVTSVKINFSYKNNIDLSEGNIKSMPHYHQFCKCSDYGVLAYNQFDNSYQHIHFTSKTPLDCSPDVVFGIYEDNDTVNIDEVRENLDHMEDNTDYTDFNNFGHSFCWYNAESVQNKFGGDFEKRQKQENDFHSNYPTVKPTLKQYHNKALNHFNNSSDYYIDYQNEMLMANRQKQDLKSESCVDAILDAKDPVPSIELGITDNLKNHNENTTNLALQRQSRKRKILHNSHEDIKRGRHTFHEKLTQSDRREKYFKGWKGVNVDQQSSHGSEVYRCAHCTFSCKNAKKIAKHLAKCKGKSGLNTRNSDGPTGKEVSTNVTCGVCKTEVTPQQWISHIQREHNYQAWRDGDTPLNVNDEESVRRHLYKILQEQGRLECSKCGKSRKYIKLYLQHIKSCRGSKESNDNAEASYAEWESSLNISKDDDGVDGTKIVECAVCHLYMEANKWVDHIKEEHNYLSWQEGNIPLDTLDQELVRRYLYVVMQKLGSLVCSKCGIVRKYVKSYLSHIENCTGQMYSDEQNTFNADNVNESLKESIEEDRVVDVSTEQVNATLPEETLAVQVCPSTVVKCGVCQEELEESSWITHIATNHEYLAWKETEEPLNIENDESVRKHLYSIQQKYGPLVCSKCGTSRKYVKLYKQHIETCTGPKEPEDTIDTSCAEWESVLDISLDNGVGGTEIVKCAICHLEMEAKQWIDHIQKEHKYLSWQEGKTPLDLYDKESVRRYLYLVVQKLGSLVCAKCGIVRKYVKSYLSHMEMCSQKSTNKGTKIKCGVCHKEMCDSNWMVHIAMNHDYLAWKEGETPIDLNNYEAIYLRLANVIKDTDALKCADCGRKCKCPKTYLLHIKACYGQTYVTPDDENSTLDESVSQVDSTLDTSCEDEEDTDDSAVVKCGVCKEEVKVLKWIHHIRIRHNYMAWRDGDKPLDLENEEAVLSHLKSIIRDTGHLSCMECGLSRKQVASFYTHSKTCDGTPLLLGKPMKSVIRKSNSLEIVKCALCATEMSDSLWIDHIAKKHDYMAWREGEKPLDLDDEVGVRDHLYSILRYTDELVCSKCGESRKYVKSYLQHCRGCTGSDEPMDGSYKATKPNEEYKGIVTCAICKQEMDDSVWIEHISKEHNYVSWKLNRKPLVFKNETALRDYLYNIVQSIGTLVCNKCGVVRKYAKTYLQHIEACQKVTWRSINRMITKMEKERPEIVTCAVCRVEVKEVEWIEHIATQHNYLAWRDGDTHVNLENEKEVRNHLKNIILDEGYLQCPKCKIRRKYAKLYLQHVNNCDGTVVRTDEANPKEQMLDTTDVEPDGSVIVVCGVCGQSMENAAWLTHIQKEHKYLAWQEGKEPIDLNDKEAVYNHLYAVNTVCKGLTCYACGTVRRHVKAYLHHLRSCNRRNYMDSDETVECGVCGEKVVGKSWKDHAMEVHYNVAWVSGDTPLELRNFFGIDKCLKDYFDCKRKLVCKICGLSRASLAGFYAHILVCGKTEEEVDSWKDLCEICNQKYLCIYKTQHYWGHKMQEVAKERKIKEKLMLKSHNNDIVNHTASRRRAAEKARSVIGDYAAELEAHTNKCKSCGCQRETDDTETCRQCGKPVDNLNDASDDSVSVKLDDYSDDDSEETDSNVSIDEEDSTEFDEKKKKIRKEPKRVKSVKKILKFPLEVNDIRQFIQESRSDYFKLYYTKETLFPHWRDFTYEVLSAESLPQYMPQLEESCKVTISNGDWTTYKRFESRKEKDFTVLFTGASIQCIAWAPEHPEQTACRSMLAVATHRGPDCPRLLCTDTSSHPALIQMWAFEDFKTIPKFAFGLAHDYGTVWAMDWCPSGARDITDNVDTEENKRPRLGLLAMACSNGSAYVVSVPFPEENLTGDKTFYKIKPCLELRLTRGNNKNQATSINWSMFKGYTTISVGYGDGTMAFYDLVTESPLLTDKEGDITVLYPYQDERVHNSCVTGLTSSVLGAWCSSSPTGSTAGVTQARTHAGPGAHLVRTHTVLAGTTATFLPHWPNVLISGDDTIVGLSPSELEWGYVGRRLGSLRALAPCVNRARVAALVPPLLQTMRLHPAMCKGNKTLYKKNVAMIEMIPLAKKRSKHNNDELSMKVEPITYEDAIASYGIEFKLEKDFDKAFVLRMQAKHRVPFPERFPLADVPALAYCPAAAHYSKLALATHAGLLILLNV